MPVHPLQREPAVTAVTAIAGVPTYADALVSAGTTSAAGATDTAFDGSSAVTAVAAVTTFAEDRAGREVGAINVIPTSSVAVLRRTPLILLGLQRVEISELVLTHIFQATFVENVVLSGPWFPRKQLPFAASTQPSSE